MRWLKNFLPIVLIALAVQIFAPIGACWSASIAASDPLAGAVICHGNATPGAGQSDQTGHRAHDGCCSVCSVLQTGAPVDTPQIAAAMAIDRRLAMLPDTRLRRTICLAYISWSQQGLFRARGLHAKRGKGALP